MEGQVGNIFETQFRYTVHKNSKNTSVEQTPYQTNSSNTTSSIIPKDVKDKSVNHILRNSGIAAGIGVAILTPVVVLVSKGKFPKLSNYINKSNINYL